MPLRMLRAKALRRLPPDALIEVDVSNFGPILKGKFAIRPLTIFVGPNNSGKTYAATLAHSLLSSYGRRTSPWDISTWIKPHLKSKSFQRAIVEMENLALSSVSEPKPVPDKYSNLASSILMENSLKQRIIENIQTNFSTDAKNLIRFKTKSSSIDISHNINTHITLSQNKPPSIKTRHPTRSYVIRNFDGTIRIYDHDSQHKQSHANAPPRHAIFDLYAGETLSLLNSDHNLGLRAFLILALKIESYYLQNIPRSYYLPAARAGILSAYETIVSSVMQNSKYAGTRPFTIEQLSGVTSDFITHLIHVNVNAPTKIRNGNSIIGDMFGGSLILSKPKTGLPKILYRSSGVDIPMHRSSSAITETAPLEILQNYAPYYDVLVLEEPEAHLHPANQTKLAKHIIRFIKRGTRVMLITHGVFFLEQLSMFMRMSKISPAKRKELGYDDDDFIDDTDVAPYVFKRDAKGGYSIRELNHSAEEGIWQDEFIHVTESMYEKDVEIDNFIESQ